MIRAFFMSNRK